MPRRARRCATLAACLLVSAQPLRAVDAAARSAVAVQSDDAEIEPIRCWRRIDKSAVHLGEQFSLVVTCAVIETNTVTVRPDQSKFDTAATQLAPFELVESVHPADIRTETRRFLQYRYMLRLIDDAFIGSDVGIPALQVGYRVQNRVQQGPAVQGRDQTYVLPAASIKILSLVPKDADDIRDAPEGSFADIQGRIFRANTARLLAVLSLGMGVALLAVGAIRATRRRAGVKKASGTALAPEWLIWRGIARELKRVQQRAREDGWSPDLAARAVTALRIAAGLALARRTSQFPIAAGGDGHEGQLRLRTGWRRGRHVLVSASVTPKIIAGELADGPGRASRPTGIASLVNDLRETLAVFSAARYSRTPLDTTRLDEAISNSISLIRRLRVQRLWLVRYASLVRRPAAAVGT